MEYTTTNKVTKMIMPNLLVNHFPCGKQLYYRQSAFSIDITVFEKFSEYHHFA